ncbi:MAG: peptidoglycan D,D-transpeptidase FtsI family protein [Elusimicrobiota bacterium]
MPLRFRLHAVRFLFLCAFSAVLARLAYLQVWRHDELSARAEQQANRRLRETPRRGPILDRHGQALAVSVRSASCYADPALLPDPAKAARLLAGPLEMSPSVLLAKIRRAPGSFVWLKRSLPVEQAMAVEKLNLLGVGLNWEYEREYPEGALASHLLGRIGTDGRGLSGVEQVADDWLTDPRPPRRALRDGRGEGVVEGPPEDDQDRTWVRLTLDRTLQYIAERELEAGMARSGSRAGLIVVQDPWTGEILALASRPDLPAGRPASARDLFIPAVHWTFEPGSTFKVVTAAAALEEKLVRPQELIDCERGAWKVADIKIHDHDKEGVLTFAQVIERSSNIGTAKVGMRLGKTKLHDYARAFGFGSRTGSELPGESPGLLKPPSKWSGVSLPVISFGQEVGASALQIVGAFSAVANGGVLMEPRLFRQMRNARGETRDFPAPAVVRRVVSQETAGALKDMLEGVVTRGTGQAARLDGWTAAGKTGTAQKIEPETGRYSRDKFVASFCGFAPAGKPRFVILVVYDEPKGPEWGGHNAGPVFKSVARHALSYVGVPPDGEVQVAQRRARKPVKL